MTWAVTIATGAALRAIGASKHSLRKDALPAAGRTGGGADAMAIAGTTMNIRSASRFALFLAAAFFSSVGIANADLTLTNTSVADEFTITDAGGCSNGCIPIGQTGYIVDSTAPNMIAAAGLYKFTYLGAGDSVFDNTFTVAGGGTFCSQSFAGCNGGVASTIGDSFTVYLPAGDVPFVYTADSASNGTGGCVVSDSSTTNALPGNGCADYFLSLDNSTGTPGLTGPSQPFGYIGLTDSPFPGDHDFQDLAVRIDEVPEPASMALLGAGLAGLGFLRRRKRA